MEHLEEPGKAMFLAGPYPGIVLDNADPQGRHRVRVTVPGMIERSGWAYPATMGGGGPARRGGHVAPDVGATVFIWPIMGNPDRLLYLCGPWGAPGDTDELPDVDTEEAPVEQGDRHLVQAFGFRRLRIVVDEREGHEKLVVQDTQFGDAVTFDMVNGGIIVSASTGLVLKAAGAVSIEGATVSIQGRVVNVATSRNL